MIFLDWSYASFIFWYICFGSVTRNYFENLVRALENGLSDVGSNGAAFSKATSSKNAAGSSKGRSGRGKGTFRSSTPSKMNDDSHWCCEHCTYANVKSASTCQMCYQQRRWKLGSPFEALVSCRRPLHQKLRWRQDILCSLQFCDAKYNRMKGVRHGRKVALHALLFNTKPNLMYIVFYLFMYEVFCYRHL